MKLSFHGAERGVTGSCHLVELEQGKLLVDCGLFQGERLCGGKNFEAFGFDPKEVDAVIITHAHLDHIGRLPLLVKKGFSGKIHMTPPTKTLTKLVLEDAHRVMVEEAEKCGSPVLYEPDHVQKVLEMCTGVNYHTEFEPLFGVKVSFSDAGHILGSAFVTMQIPGEEFKDGMEKTIVFSGDIGNDYIPILASTESILRADIIVTESTYGDRDHEPVETRQELLRNAVKRVMERKGTLIIPAFSIERTQELLYEIDQLVDAKEIPSVPIYLDSPLAIRTTQAYRDFAVYLRFDRSIQTSPDRDFFSFPKFRETLSIDESKMINNDMGRKIIIAGSGMMTGGRVLHHLKRYLPDERNEVLIIGYQGEGTLGRRVQEKQPVVHIHGMEVEVKAEVEKIEAFSAHADRGKMREWIKPQEGIAQKVFLVHGDPEAKTQFKAYIEEKQRGEEVIIPEYQESFEF